MKLSNREKTLIVIACVLLAFLIYFRLYLKPIVDQIIEAKVSIQQNSQLVQKNSKTGRKTDEQESLLKNYNTKIQQLSQGYFCPVDMSSVLVLFEKLEIKYDITIDSISVNDYIEKEGYRILPIDISLKTDQETFNKFINDVENYEKKIILMSVNISSQDEEGILNITSKLGLYEITGLKEQKQ
ncbi:MAG: type 4a pilus biogenesis protein PilO [Clostridia bacterium]|nr:type 4a pilus biogenesis protein PilO [Clostridia bacterium]